jgi:hypothetical protein
MISESNNAGSKKLWSLFWTGKWLICILKFYVNFKLRTQLWTEFFIFRSGLTVTGLMRMYCIQAYYGNSPRRGKVTWLLSKVLQCGNGNRRIVLTWLLKFVRCAVCFKKSVTTSKTYINLFRGHVQCFELSQCIKTYQVLSGIVMVNEPPIRTNPGV